MPLVSKRESVELHPNVTILIVKHGGVIIMVWSYFSGKGGV